MSAQVYPLLSRDVFATYGYFIVDDASGHGFLIDPGAQPNLFLQAINENGWSIEAILLTHGHFDHMGAASTLRDALGVPIMAHELADRYLLDTRMNLSAEHGRNITVADTMKFSDGDRISLSEGNLALDVLHVPGHTDDSCAFYCKEDGFSLVGDTVYEGGPGLTVFPTGDVARLHESIRSRLFALPDDTLLLSGHSRPMSVRQLRLVTG